MEIVEKQFLQEQGKYSVELSKPILIAGIDTFDYTYVYIRCEEDLVDKVLKDTYNKNVWIDILQILDLRKDYKDARVNQNWKK